MTMEKQYPSRESPLESENRARKQLFPFLDLNAEYGTIKEQTPAAVQGVLESQQFIMGPELEKLEAEVARLKAKPVFVDIDPKTYNFDCKQLEAAFTRNTKAIIPVHLFGLPAEMEPIMEIARAHRVAVIEDAAQAIGSRYHDKYVGNIGTCGCFSFFPSMVTEA